VNFQHVSTLDKQAPSHPSASLFLVELRLFIGLTDAKRTPLRGGDRASRKGFECSAASDGSELKKLV
jgi:hypothetical protein